MRNGADRPQRQARAAAGRAGDRDPGRSQQPCDELRASTLGMRATNADGAAVCRMPRYRETLPNGATYLVIDHLSQPLDEFRRDHGARRCRVRDGRQPRPLGRQPRPDATRRASAARSRSPISAAGRSSSPSRSTAAPISTRSAGSPRSAVAARSARSARRSRRAIRPRPNAEW